MTYTPTNLESMIDLYSVLFEMDQMMIMKAMIYVTFYGAILSIQTIIIYAHIMLETRTVEDFGATYVVNSI